MDIAKRERKGEDGKRGDKVDKEERRRWRKGVGVGETKKFTM